MTSPHLVSKEVMLRCIWRWLVLRRVGAPICSPSRAGSRNAHCTIRMSTFSKEDLFDACKKGDIARVRQAVADGDDVRKVVDKYWDTPLHYACGYVACETHPLYTL